MNRYIPIHCKDAIVPALHAILRIVDDVFAIEKQGVPRAAEITQNPARRWARIAVHIALMERHDNRSILSFDADFDRWPGLQRIHQL